MKIFYPVCLVVTALILSGCAGTAPLSFSGTMSIPSMAWDGGDDKYTTEAGDNCLFKEGESDYPDIDAGTQVTLRDSTGATVGLTNLRQGSTLIGWSESGTPVYRTGDTIPSFTEDFCVFKFEFLDVESEDTFFSVEVGKRGQIQYTREQLETSGVGVSLG